jgi:hypothetical protein
MKTLWQLANQDIVPPRTLNPGVDHDLNAICLNCLEKDPKDRYPSALALAEDLERWLASKSIAARPMSKARQLWRWWKR